ncbi:MAG TPA: glycerol-3-phosphate 1-O-acyltransferase PlsY [Kiloniellales bacterium]|nr:glycerol-3-phosphate 1-O-acyltransferase PlsY [Kiloniellales bacterium]
MPDPISWSYSWPYFLGAFLLAYLLGSIPFGLLLTRAAGFGDIRAIGSGNIGATNVLRTGNKLLALAVLLLDAGKGALAVLLAWWIGGTEVALIAALGAVLGHMFPPWLGFKGGKAVATALGTLLALSPWVGVLVCLTWLVVALATRYSSLAGLLSLALAPFYAWLLPLGFRLEEVFEPGFGSLLFRGEPKLIQISAIVAILVWMRHHQNIRRLLRGEEPKIGRRREAATTPGSSR